MPNDQRSRNRAARDVANIVEHAVPHGCEQAEEERPTEETTRMAHKPSVPYRAGGVVRQQLGSTWIKSTAVWLGCLRVRCEVPDIAPHVGRRAIVVQELISPGVCMFEYDILACLA